MNLPLAVPLTALLAWLMAASAQAGGAARITTESAEYREDLAQRLTALPKAAEAVPSALAEEGRRLRADGHFRSGIAKLRRAIRAAQG